MSKAIHLPAAPAFLVVRLRQLGDIAVSTPVLRTLRANFPQCRIELVVEKPFARLFGNTPLVDAVHAFDRGWDRLPLRDRAARYREFFKNLRRRRFDVAVDLHNNPRSILIATLARADVRIGYRKVQNLFFDFRLAKLDDSRHTSDRLLHLLSPLGLPRTERAPDLPLPAAVLDSVRARCNVEPKKYAVLCPGSNKRFWTQWAPENFAQVARGLAGPGHPVWIVCGPKETDLADYFSRELADVTDVHVSRGDLDTLELAALISMARLYIGNNSGPLHVAGAVHTPAIGVFGPHSPESWGVMGADHENLFVEVGCNPCRETACPHEPRKCLQAVLPERVLDAARRFL